MKAIKGIIGIAFLVLIILALPLCFFYEEALGHPDENGDCHRPYTPEEDPDGCKHACDHTFCVCARPCVKDCEGDANEWCYDKCFKKCFRANNECIEGCKNE